MNRQYSESITVQSSRSHKLDAPRSLQDAIQFTYSARGHVTAGRVPTREAIQQAQRLVHQPRKPQAPPPDWLKDRKVNERFLSHQPTEWSLARRKHSNGITFKSNFTSSEVRLAEALSRKEVLIGSYQVEDGTQEKKEPDIATTRACAAVLKDIASTSSLPPALQILLQKLSSHIEAAIFRPDRMHFTAPNDRKGGAKNGFGTGTSIGTGIHSLSHPLAYTGVQNTHDEQGSGGLAYFQYALGLDEERKKIEAEVGALKSAHKAKVDEALELITRRSQNVKKLETLTVETKSCDDKLSNLRQQKLSLQRQLDSLQVQHDGIVKSHDEAREATDSCKAKVWDLQQHTMSMKMQRKAVYTQIQDHKNAEEHGLVPAQLVREAEEDVKAAASMVESKKESYSQTLKKTVKVLEEIRTNQNKRKEVQLHADILAAEQTHYLRSHTPRPEWTDTQGDFLPSLRLDGDKENENDVEESSRKNWSDVNEAGEDALLLQAHEGKERYELGREQRRREQASGGEACDKSTVDRVQVLSSTMREMRVETKAHRLLESRQRLTKLRGDLHMALQDLKATMNNNPHKALAVAPAASAMLTKDGKSFVGKGMAENVPRYLRTNEKVGFRLLPMKELQSLIRDIWLKKKTWGVSKTGAEVPAANLGSNMTMSEFLYRYLQRRYGIHPVIVKWGYAITYAVLNFKWDEEVELFWLVLTSQMPEEVYYYQDDMLKSLKVFLKKMNGQLLGNVKDANHSVLVKKADCTFFLSSFFPKKTSEDFNQLRGAADKTMLIGGPGDAPAKTDKELSPSARRRKAERQDRMEREKLEREREMIQNDSAIADANGNSSANGGNGLAAGAGVGLGVGDAEEGKEWKEGDDMDIDLLLTPSEDGERTVFEKTIRAQHLHEVQQLLGHLEDQLTIGAAPGVLIRASKFLQICQGFNEEISAKDVIHVLNAAPEPHHDQRKEEGEGNTRKRATKGKTSGSDGAGSGSVDNGASSEGAGEGNGAGAATLAKTAASKDAAAYGGGDRSSEEMAAAIAMGMNVEAASNGKQQTSQHWHGLNTKNFAKKGRTVLVDINVLVYVMKQKGLVRGLLNQYTHESVERSDTHITSVAERRASAIHRWNLARMNLAGLVRFRVESNLVRSKKNSDKQT